MRAAPAAFYAGRIEERPKPFKAHLLSRPRRALRSILRFVVAHNLLQELTTHGTLSSPLATLCAPQKPTVSLSSRQTCLRGLSFVRAPHLQFAFSRKLSQNLLTNDNALLASRCPVRPKKAKRALKNQQIVVAVSS